MFRGSSTHTCDPKGRLIVPSRFRDVLQNGGGDGLMITVGSVPCLFAYTYNEWERLEKDITDSQTTNSSEIRRLFIGYAQDCPCDKQGRILIPKTLRDYAGIDKDLMLVGMRIRFEIWSLENWDRETKKAISSLNSGELKNELAALRL